MKRRGEAIKTTAVLLGPPIVMLGLIYVFLAAVGLAWTPYTCLTETKQKIANLSGLDFEISYTNCDTLAKTESMSVFVSETGGRRKTLLFKFDPIYWVPLPAIKLDQPKTIVISVSEISSIYSKIDQWKDMSVIYDIGHIEYPDEQANTSN